MNNRIIVILNVVKDLLPEIIISLLICYPITNPENPVVVLNKTNNLIIVILNEVKDLLPEINTSPLIF